VERPARSGLARAGGSDTQTLGTLAHLRHFKLVQLAERQPLSGAKQSLVLRTRILYSYLIQCYMSFIVTNNGVSDEDNLHDFRNLFYIGKFFLEQVRKIMVKFMILKDKKYMGRP
jgi:hypothetical protein